VLTVCPPGALGRAGDCWFLPYTPLNLGTTDRFVVEHREVGWLAKRLGHFPLLLSEFFQQLTNIN